MAEVNIVALSETDIKDASRVLGEAFATNPALVRGIGGTEELRAHRGTRLYELTFSNMPGESFVAKSDGQVLGAMRVVESGRCQPGMLEQLRLLPQMAWILRRSMLTAGRWFAAWGKADPDEPHIHLGPVGVDPTHQGQGIGSRMMEHFVAQLDSTSQAGYLETDKDVNVPFYEKFGFKVTRELPVLGVTTWLMWRDPKS